jgi:hypothetical protein
MLPPFGRLSEEQQHFLDIKYLLADKFTSTTITTRHKQRIFVE